MTQLNTNRNRGCSSIILNILGLSSRLPKDDELEEPEVTSNFLPYHVREHFLSPAELSFHHVLRSVVEDRATINSQVRLQSIFFVERPHENAHYRAKIAQKSIDFLLCDPKTLQPIVGIELDDASHKRPDRQERDEFVDRVFESAQLPLLHFPAQRTYNTRELATQLASYISGLDSPATGDDVASSATPICPNCHIPLVERVASQGEHRGKKFYGCTNYPKCNVIIPVD